MNVLRTPLNRFTDPSLSWSPGSRGEHIAELQAHLKTVLRILEFNSRERGDASPSLPNIVVNGVLDRETLQGLRVFKAELGDRFQIRSRGEELDPETLQALSRFVLDSQALKNYLNRHHSDTSRHRKHSDHSIDSILSGKSVLVPGEKSEHFRHIGAELEEQLRVHARRLQTAVDNGTASAQDTRDLELINALPSLRRTDHYSAAYQRYVELYQRLEGLKVDGKIGEKTLSRILRSSESDARLSRLADEFHRDEHLGAHAIIGELHDRLGLLRHPEGPRIYGCDLELKKSEIRFGVTPTRFSRYGDLGYAGLSYDRKSRQFFIGPAETGIQIEEYEIPKILEIFTAGVHWGRETSLIPLSVFRTTNGEERLIHITSGLTPTDHPQSNARWYRVRIGTKEDLLRGEFEEHTVTAASIAKDGLITLKTKEHVIQVPLDPARVATFSVDNSPMHFIVGPEKRVEVGMEKPLLSPKDLEGIIILPEDDKFGRLPRG